MKKRYIAILLCLNFSIIQITNAQQTPIQGTIQHNDKTRPCLVVNVDPEPKTLKKEWEDYLKNNFGFKLKGIGFLTNKDLLSAKEITINAISPNAMDFYTEIIEDEIGSQMKVFATFGYDLYINPTENLMEFNALKKIVTDFLDTYIPNYYQELVDDAEDAVNDLSKEQEKLKKAISKDTKDIDKMTNKIEGLTEDISDNKTELIQVEEKLSNRLLKLEKYKAKLNAVKQ